jgi:cytoskeleton protein RodZ
MNDPVTNPETATAAEQGGTPTRSFGAALAAAREGLSLSVGDMAARLRIHPRQIAAIEREDLAALPAPAYVRGFVRNYAREVRIDPEPLVESLNRMIAPPAVAQPLAASPLVQVEERSRLSRAVVIVVAIGALLVFALVGWLTTRDRSATKIASTEVAAGSVAAGNAEVAPLSRRCVGRSQAGRRHDRPFAEEFSRHRADGARQFAPVPRDW